MTGLLGENLRATEEGIHFTSCSQHVWRISSGARASGHIRTCYTGRADALPLLLQGWNDGQRTEFPDTSHSSAPGAFLCRIPSHGEADGQAGSFGDLDET